MDCGRTSMTALAHARSVSDKLKLRIKNGGREVLCLIFVNLHFLGGVLQHCFRAIGVKRGSFVT